MWPMLALFDAIVGSWALGQTIHLVMLMYACVCVRTYVLLSMSVYMSVCVYVCMRVYACVCGGHACLYVCNVYACPCVCP